MPISVPGPGSHALQQGFSLLEMLVVLTIIGIATATVSVSAFSAGDGRALREDAIRLTHLFAVAQAEARRTGSPVIWHYDTEGYGFSRAPRELFLPAGMARQLGPVSAIAFGDASSLRPRSWAVDNAVQVDVQPPATNVFNTEWISGPSAIELNDGTNTVRIRRSGNGQYRVLP